MRDDAPCRTLTARALGRCQRLFRAALRAVFGFDGWHTGIPADRPYIGAVAEYLNARAKKHSAAEIGCGLGDIIGRLDFDRRVALDADPGVLRAASFLAMFSRGIEFRRFSFPEDTLEGRYDAVILVNWVHNIPSDRLTSALCLIASDNLEPGGEIIIDTVADDGYRYHHSASELASSCGMLEAEIGAFERGRKIYALKKGGGK